MTNRKLRKALLDKLNITPQALSQRVQKLKGSHPLTTQDATYIIAHREGIRVDRYLDKGTVDHIRQVLRDIGSPTSTQGDASRRKASAPTPRTVHIGSDFKLTDPLITSAKVSEAKEMSTVYPLLYVLENSIRAFIDGVMTARHGTGWFANVAPSRARSKVLSRRQDDNRNLWHQRRGSRDVDYVDLGDLTGLARKAYKASPKGVLPSEDWLPQLIDEVNKSRCVLCHMNPLEKLNIQAVKLRFKQWQKQMKAKAHLLPR